MRFGFCLVTLLGFGGTAFGAPEDRGPYAPSVFDAGSLAIEGVQIPAVVYYSSEAPGPGPTVIMMHGNLRNGSYHTELANTLASRGFVVVVPDMPCGLGGCVHDENAAQLSALLEWAAAQNDDPASPIYQKSDGRRGLLGHSYGGLGVFLATARDPTVQAVVAFDPKDDLGAGAAEAMNIHVPSAHLMADVRGVCNDEWGSVVYPDTPTPHLRVRVVGAAHCDVEEPSDSLCSFVCGQGNGETAPFRRYAVAFMSCVLQGDETMAPYIGGSSLAADQTAGVVDQVDQAGLETLPCNTRAQPPDPVDAGQSPDAGSGLDASSPDSGSDAGGAGDESSGCGTIEGSGSPALIGVVFGLALALGRRRRGARH